jgi:tRNA(Ile)-lysidine synthase
VSTQIAPPDALVARFRDDLAGIARSPVERPAIAVSGGPDSLALLLLANAAFPDILAITVDHGFRAEAADEARFVATLCASAGIEHVLLTLSPPATGNRMAWAREERYAAMSSAAAQHGCDAVLTGHHADDQLETVIMRLNRGSGVAGLAGVRPWHDGPVPIARPLLGWRKSELIALVEQASWTAIDDPSNRDDRFDRARLRKALSAADWLDPVAVAHSAALLAEAEEALIWAAKAAENRRVGGTGGNLSFHHDGLPNELKRRIVLFCIRRLVPEAAPRSDELTRLVSGLEAGRIATLAGVKCTGGEFWLFSVAPPRRKD